MKAVTVVPKQPATAALTDVPEPSSEEGSVLVEAVAVGVCGTDEEIVAGGYGWPPPGRERLVLGHESLGRVVQADAATGLARGDLVVGIVRHPDPVPCANCAIGEWDMCRNGRYTEHGIKERDGFMRERYRLEPSRAIKVDPSLGDLAVLMEPTTIVAKAWEHLERIGSRARWEPKTCLVTGAGPVGLLAAMLGVERGLEVHVLDRVESGPKPRIVDALGAHYHAGDIDDSHDIAYDVVVEATGVGELAFKALRHTGPNGVVALTGISSSDRMFPVDSDLIGEDMVLKNIALFGSVNANRRHYEQAAAALAAADRNWLSSLITRKVSLDRWHEALARQPDDVKVVVTFS